MYASATLPLGDIEGISTRTTSKMFARKHCRCAAMGLPPRGGGGTVAWPCNCCRNPKCEPLPWGQKKDKKAFKEHRNKKADEKDQDSRRSKKPAWGRCLPSGSRFPLLLCCFCCLLSSAAAVPGSSSNGTLDAIKPWPPRAH